MEPLIFDRQEVRWEELSYPAAAALRAATGTGMPLRTFAGPGNGANASLQGVKQSQSGLTFPNFGHWRLIGSFGALKLLLIDPATPRDDVPRQLLAFVAANIWHRPVDHYLAHIGGDRQIFQFDRVGEKFFHSDQPLGFHCGYATRFLAVLLDYLGYRVRVGSVRDARGGHIFPEVYLPGISRWAIVDPDFGVMVSSRGQPLCGEEMIELALAGGDEEIQVIDVAGKHFPVRDNNQASASFGQLTWHPGLMDAARACAKRYRENVVLRRFPSVDYQEAEVIKTVHRVMRMR